MATDIGQKLDVKDKFWAVKQRKNDKNLTPKPKWCPLENKKPLIAWLSGVFCNVDFTDQISNTIIEELQRLADLKRYLSGL